MYRIVTRGTVEEKIVKRAKQKQNVQSREGREIREMLDLNIVDGLEYVKVKEKIAETR